MNLFQMPTILKGLLFAVCVGNASAESCRGQPVAATFDGSMWPDLWRLGHFDTENRQNRNQPAYTNTIVDPSVLAAAGVTHRKLDPSNFTYPESSGGSWEPPGNSTDPELQSIRQDLNYSYADIITVRSVFESFWDEHLHAHSTVRYIINGSGYFDLRDTNDHWVRMHVKKGDFVEWPAGIYHRFVVDNDNFITAMRLFKGSPEWTSYPRSSVEANNTVRNNYVEKYLCGDDEDQYDVSVPTPTSRSSRMDDMFLPIGIAVGLSFIGLIFYNVKFGYAPVKSEEKESPFPIGV